MRIWKASLKLTGHYPLWYLGSAFVWALAFFVPIGTGLSVRALLDGLVPQPPDAVQLSLWILLILAIRLLRSALDFPAAYVFASHLGRIRALLRSNVLRGVIRGLGSPSGVPEVGDTLNRLRDDVEPVALLPADENVDALGRGLRLIVMVGILLSASPLLTGVLVPALVACGVAARLASARLVRYREASRASTGSAAGFLNEVLHGVQALKLGRAEASVTRAYERLGEARREASLRDILASETINKGLDWLTQVAGGTVLLLAAPGLARGSFGIGDLALFLLYLDPVADSVSFFTNMMIVYRQANVSMARLKPLLPEGEEDRIVEPTRVPLRGALPEIPAPARGPQDALACLRVRSLSCLHAGERRGVRDVSFSVAAGTLTVITGRIGCGKSTLLRALLGLLPLDGGEVFWNEEVVRDRGRLFQPPRTAYVPQAPALFSDTLRANILLGRVEDADVLEEALGRTVLEPDVADLAEGLETVIGPRGMKLSGGQQQRTALARAFAQRPSLLVLDDVSSALDVETERLLWSRLLAPSIGGERLTCLAVSHSREALARADTVLVLKDGRLEAAGTLAELLLRGGEMRALWEAHSR